MKEKWLRAGKIALIVLGVLLFLFVIGFGRHCILASQIDRITLRASDGSGVKTVELSDAEIFGFTAIYNLSRYAGMVDAEGCSIKFDIDVYFHDGKRMSILDHKDARMEVEGIDSPGLFVDEADSRSFWVDNPLLLGYIKLLVNAHGLEWETWDSC